MSLIDSHCHLTYEPLYSNLTKLISSCKDENISHLLSISTNLETSIKSIEIANTYENVFTTIGVHPLEIKKSNSNLFKIFELHKTSKKIIGIGEIGLDFYRCKDNRSEQIDIFEQQIVFALKNKLPIIIHTRSANNDMHSIIKKYSSQNNTKFLIHCFSEDAVFCKQMINLGCYISFSGIVTFKNAKEIQKSAKIVPLDRILIETDSPYLSPEPIRGKPNSPINVKYVAKKISEIKNIDYEIIENQTTQNFLNFFSI